jgi:hypothetical protein
MLDRSKAAAQRAVRFRRRAIDLNEYRIIDVSAERAFDRLIAGGRHDAAGAFEGRVEHWLLRDRLGPRVERRWHFLGGLFPPAWNEAPAHRDKLGGTIRQSHDVDRRYRSDIVAGAQVSRGLGEPIKLDQFAPSVALGEASAHGASFITCKIADAEDWGGQTPICAIEPNFAWGGRVCGGPRIYFETRGRCVYLYV